MTDSERLKAVLREAKNEHERLNLLKYYHREVQVERLTNARNHESGKIDIENAKNLSEGLGRFKKEVEENLKLTDKGKSYLFGQEAQTVTIEVNKEDHAIRTQKADQVKKEQAKKVLEAKEKRISEEAAKLPRGAEVSEKDLKGERETNKGKAAEIMAFLAAQQEKRDQEAKQPKTKAELEEERKKKKERDRGMEP